MAFRTNYNQQRGDRDRAKAAKKQEKLQRRDDLSQKRKGEDGEPIVEGDEAATGDSQAPQS